MVKGNEGHYSTVKILKSNYSLSNRTLKKLTSVGFAVERNPQKSDVKYKVLYLKVSMVVFKLQKRVMNLQIHQAIFFLTISIGNGAWANPAPLPPPSLR